jgi:hypothetical protein
MVVFADDIPARRASQSRWQCGRFTRQAAKVSIFNMIILDDISCAAALDGKKRRGDIEARAATTIKASVNSGDGLRFRPCGLPSPGKSP